MNILKLSQMQHDARIEELRRRSFLECGNVIARFCSGKRKQSYYILHQKLNNMLTCQTEPIVAKKKENSNDV